jgi:hypothetical protein
MNSALLSILDQLEKIDIVYHPVHQISSEAITEWLEQKEKVATIMAALPQALFQDLPEESRRILMAIWRKESELVWTSDHPHQDEEGTHGPFPSCYP